MSLTSIVQLINSLSAVEKRQFKLATKKQSGTKRYLDLFNLIDRNGLIPLISLKEKFEKIHPTVSIDNTGLYLQGLITDSLIQAKLKDDSYFQLLYGLMRVRLLRERSLQKESYKELQRLQQKAVSSQNQILQYIIYREELEHLNETGFLGISEKQMVDMQMAARATLKNIWNIHEHHSLLELLRHRLIHAGKVLSDEEKRRLDDLILTELGLVTGRIKQIFETQKLHSLFQSFFFANTGDYKSALKTFHTLNKLFEKNVSLWGNPPIDYFSALDGILDSLRTNEHYDQMEYYIKKLEHLDNPSYPEYFSFKIKKTIMLYRLIIFIENNKLNSAIDYIEHNNRNNLNAYNLIDDEKTSELFFFISLIYFRTKNLKKAHKAINEVILIGKIRYHSVIYRASRLLNLLIHYENKDFDQLSYEIRSYKRSLQNKGKLLKTEKVVLKAIGLQPYLNKIRKNEILWKGFIPTVKAIENDKYEKQLLKYFNFIEWTKSKFIT